MKKSSFLPGKLMAVLISVILAGFISLGSLNAQTVINSLTIGAQTGSVTYGTPGSVTFSVAFTKSGSGSGLTRLNVVWTPPTGVTTSFPVDIDPSLVTSPVTLTISTSAATPAGTTGFAISSTSNAFTSPTAYFVVSVKPLTVTGAAAANKEYDRTNLATITGTLSGKVGSDVVNLSGSGYFTSINVANNIPVTSTCTLTGAQAGNYSLVQPTGLTANITPKQLTITGLSGSNKVYDGTTTATLSGTPVLNGVLAGDAGLVTIAGSAVATFADALVGNGKPITVSGYSLTGSASVNYQLVQPTGLTGNITGKPLTITGISGVNKEYDGTASASLSGTPALSGVLPADVPNVALGGTPVAVFVSASAGTGKSVTVTGYTISGTASANYTLIQPAGIFADITPKPLTITGAVANNKVYNATNAATISGVLSGIISPDVVTLNGTGIFASSNVANGIPVLATCTLSGAAAGNYSVIQPVGLTANITPKNLTITGAAAQNKPYDGNTTATITGTLAGIAGTDVVTLNGIGTFANPAVGNGKPVTAACTLGGASALNYTLSQPTGLTANITTKQLTITGLTGVNKEYDGTTTATTSGTAALSGVVEADIPNVSLTTGTLVMNFATASVGTAKPITITGYTLSGSAAGNYTLVQPTGVTADITPKALTVPDAAAVNKVYNGNNIAGITGTLTGVIAPDAVTLIGTGTFATVNAGSAIAVTATCTLGGIHAANYSIIQPTGLTATITPKPLTITATGPAKTYGTSLSAGPSITYFSATSTAGSELVTSVTLRPNAEGLLAGTAAGSTYVVTPSLATGTGGFTASNYEITYVPYTGTVSPKPVTVTAKAGQRKLIGTADPVFQYTCAPALIGTDSFTGALSRTAGETVEGSPYAITLGTLSAGSNYAITFESAGFTITAASEALITAFNFTLLPNYPEVIDQTAGTIAVPVRNTSNLAALVANFTASPGAVVKVGAAVQTSGVTTNSFTGVVNYTVTSANGLVTKNYAVTVTKNPVMTEKQMLSFSFEDIPGAVGVINQTDFTVTVHVPLTLNITNLVATFTLSHLAKAYVTDLQVSGVTPNNFTSALTGSFTYKIEAENESFRYYYVTLIRDPARTDKRLLTYSLQGIAGAIDEAAHTIEVTVPHSYNITNLVATFTSSIVSTVRIGSSPGVPQVSGVTANNFTNPVVYTVVAEDATTQDYTVYVTQLPASNSKQIISYEFAGLAAPAVGVINEIAGTINVTIPYSANKTSLVATFTKSPFSVVTVNGQVQLSGVTANSFVTDVIYKVTAEDYTEKDYTVHVTQLLPSKENKLLTFSVAVPGGKVDGVVNEAAKTVLAEVPYGTNVNDLVATFTASQYATVKIGEVLQVSGVTHNDFATVREYKVIAEDGSIEKYYVTVRVLPVFLSFSFNEVPTVPSGTIDNTEHTIVVHVPFTVSRSALKAYFTVSGGSEVYIGTTLQESGITLNSFTAPLNYTLRAANGSVQNYLVTVVSDPARTEKKILSFAFNALVPPCIGVVNDTTGTVTVNVPFGTSVSSLVATFTLSEMASARIGAVAQTSGVTANNFTGPVVYTIVAENNSTQNYTVQVIVGPNPEKKILSFQLLGFATPVVGSINEELKTVTLHVPFSTNVTSLIASFTLSPNATVKVNNVLQTSGVTPNNFTSPVTYVVYAQNGSFINYTVFVIVDPNNQKKLLTFSFDDIAPKPVGIIDEANFLVRVNIPFTVSRSALRAYFTVSPNARVFVNGVLQESGVTVNNFSGDTVLYRVVAEDASIQNYKVVVRNNPIERGKEIISYNFNSTTPPSVGSIDATNRVITVHVPFNTNVTSLIATFTASPRARLNIGAVEQVSGVTVNNYSGPVTIVVIAEDATSQTYVVNVIVDPSYEKQILEFKFLSLIPAVTGVINEATKRVDLSVPYGTDVTNLIATFTTSPKSWVRIGATFQYSGVTPNNFTNALIYQVVAENGSTQNYSVVVTILPNTEKKFLTFQIEGLIVPAIGAINDVNHTIQVFVPFSTNRASLIAAYTVSAQATVWLDGIQQTSPGSPVNFTSPRTYTVRAQDGSMQAYTVTVTNSPPESGNTILTFKFAQLNPEVECVIDQANRTITGVVPYGTNVTSLVASFTKSFLSAVTIGTVVQQSGVTANNFTGPLTYRCTAEDGTPRLYTVTISVAAPSTAKDITYFAFEDLNPVAEGVINQTNKTIAVSVPYGTNIAFLRATFTLSTYATATIAGRSQSSGLTYNDYSAPVVYRIRAQDGSTADYSVTVTVSSDTTPPIVTNPSQTVSNASGQTVVVQSNEQTGKVYIIRSDAPQGTLADLDASVAAGKGRSAIVTQANTDIRLSTYTLEQAVYYTYAVDGVGNKSERGINSIFVNDVLAPNVFVHGVTLSNSLRNTVNVQSSESRGYVYLIIEGVPRSTRQELDAAVGALKGQKAMVTASNVDVPVSVYQLMPGIYRAFAVDNQNNISAESSESVIITEASHLKSILAFSFNSINPPATGQIVGTDISVRVPQGTSVTALVASFTLSPLAKVYVGLVEQVNGVTPNNFTNPLVYTVEAEDGSTLEYTVTVSFYTGINELEWFNSIKTYPNPFAERITIEMTSPADRIQILNALGQTVSDLTHPSDNVVVIETSYWMKGIYFVRCYLNEKFVGVRKIIRE